MSSFKRKTWLEKNKRKLGWILLAVLFTTLYFGGIIAQSLDPNVWHGERIYINPIYCILSNIHNPSGLAVIVMIYCLIGGFMYMRYRDRHQIMTEEDERGFKRETSGVYGTSKLMTAEEAIDFCEVEPLERTTGLILGQFTDDQIISIPKDGKRIKKDMFGQPCVTQLPGEQIAYEREKLKINGNRHCVVTGASGSGKSYCYARPAIFQSIWQGESVIVTDPKGELFADTSEYARARGYTVKIFNLMSPSNSDSWDALAELKSSSQIGLETQKFINIIIQNTSNPNSSGDKVYEDSEKSLLTAIALYILTAPAYIGPKTIGEMYQLLLRSEDDLILLFNDLPTSNAARQPWSIYMSGSEKFRGNIKAGAATRLQVLQDDVIRTIMGTPDIDLTLPGKSKCIYYVIISDMDSTFKFISSLFFTCLFNKLVEYSRRQKSGKLPVSVNCIMDEFIAIGKLPDFDKKLATVRSAGINISMIFQTLAQLQSEYPNGLWETLIANCTTMVCLSCNDMTMAKYLSDRSGITTVALENIRVDRPLIDVANVPSTVSHSYTVGERAVMQPAEIIGLAGDNKLIISILGADLIVADKFPYTAMVDPTSLIQVNMYEHAPAWRLQNSYANKKQYASGGKSKLEDGMDSETVWNHHFSIPSAFRTQAQPESSENDKTEEDAEKDCNANGQKDPVAKGTEDQEPAVEEAEIEGPEIKKRDKKKRSISNCVDDESKLLSRGF